MPIHSRAYVSPSGEMYRAYSWHPDGRERSAGPYTTRAAALRKRKSTRIQGGKVEVQVCRPEWQPVEGTEL